MKTALLLVCLGLGSLHAQVLDGDHVRQNLATKKVIPKTFVDERNVMWEKRVWRIIDCREKINQPLFYPLAPTSTYQSLWDIIRFHLEKEPGSLTAYNWFDPNNIYAQDGDQFKYPVKYNGVGDTTYNTRIHDLLYFKGEEPTEPIQQVGENGELVTVFGANGEPVFPERIDEPITAEKIVEWEIKEDWFFDTERSQMDVRIIGISPRIYDVDPVSKQIKGVKNLFWIYFPELRYIIQNYEAYNRKNDAMRMSFDDLFWKRMFSSYIKKESNVFDRTIGEYLTGVEALLESERIKSELTLIEQDLWDY